MEPDRTYISGAFLPYRKNSSLYSKGRGERGYSKLGVDGIRTLQRAKEALNALVREQMDMERAQAKRKYALAKRTERAEQALSELVMGLGVDKTTLPTLGLKYVQPEGEIDAEYWLKNTPLRALEGAEFPLAPTAEAILSGAARRAPPLAPPADVIAQQVQIRPRKGYRIRKRPNGS